MMKRLSELNKNDKVIAKCENGETIVIEAKEVEYYKNNYQDIIDFCIAHEVVANFSERSFIDLITEYFIDSQYEDWVEDMYYDLANTPQVADFVKFFNKQAAARPSYEERERILIDE